MHDFSTYDELSGPASSKFASRLGEAIRLDAIVQGRNPRIIRATQRAANDRYDLGNAHALSYGKSIGDRLYDLRPLPTPHSHVSGSDLAKIVRYCLCDLGDLAWPNLRRLVRDRGKAWAKLADCGAGREALPQEEVFETELARIDPRSPHLAERLRELADRVENK